MRAGENTVLGCLEEASVHDGALPVPALVWVIDFDGTLPTRGRLGQSAGGRGGGDGSGGLWIGGEIPV